MINIKRIIIVTIFGFIAGLFCYFGAISLNLEVDALRFIFIIVNRMLIGFVIGISALKIKWPLHGIIIGEIVGLPFVLYDIMIGESATVVIGVLIASALFGLMIEFFTSVVFKAPMEIN